MSDEKMRDLSGEPYKSHREHQAAKARLEAAAPDLLSALTELMDSLQTAYENNPEAFAEFENEVAPAAFMAACQAAKQAITKAQGKLIC